MAFYSPSFPVFSQVKIDPVKALSIELPLSSTWIKLVNYEGVNGLETILLVWSLERNLILSLA